MEKTILCYGDSNTWGFVAGKANYETMYMERYARNIRWPGLLQEYLGKNYYVVEEGLNGRTTNLDYQYYPDRNGKTYLPPCLYSHAPIDLVVLFLGGNDLKAYFNRTAKDICIGLNELIDIIQSSKYGAGMQKPPDILILSQPIPLPICEMFTDENGVFVFARAIEKAKLLVNLYSDLVKEKNCFFLDISEKIRPSKVDGLHLDAIAHKKLAKMVSDKILDIFNKILLH